MSWDEEAPVVLDNGSGMMKGGFAGEEQPRSIFPAVVGHGRGDRLGDIAVGDAALAGGAKGLTLRYPIEHGIITNWDDMERVWRRCYEELAVDPGKQALLVTEAPMNPKANREKMLELGFERLGAPAMQLQIQAVLSLYSGGRTDGLVLDSGDGVTHAVPVFDGHTVPTAIRRLDLGGRDLTEWMMELLSNDDATNRSFTTTADRETARAIKEKLCYVCDDFDAEMDAFDAAGDAKLQSFELPDGETIQVGRAMFACPELFFDPSLNEKRAAPIQQIVHDSINECGVDIRRPLLHNIVLSGGSTMFRGVETRLAAEVSKLTTARARDDVRVVAPGERKYSVWMGAAILSSLTSFSAEWITRQEYDECGASIVHRRTDAYDFVSK
jgi:actin-related protein